MKLIIFITVAVTNVFCYHDPDLDYHLNQVQKITTNCDNGYSYPTPAIQLSTSGVKLAAPAFTQLTSAPTGYASTGYSTGFAYQAVAPKITYATQPPAAYQTSSLVSNYATATKDAHGYATSTGLSSATSPRPITPLATYAQAPIIAKVTGSPLIAKFSLAPAKTTYFTQNSVSQQALSSGSLAKASLNSYIQNAGPVVSQVYAAPVKYTTSPALRVQAQQGYIAPGVQYSQAASVGQYATVSRVSAPTVSEYFSAQKATQYAAPLAQYAQGVQYTPTVTQYSAPVTQYAVPAAITHYAAPAVQYAAPAAQYVSQTVQYTAPAQQYTAPAQQYAAPAQQYTAPAQQYTAPAVQYSGPAEQYSTAAVQYSAPAVQYSSPALSTVSQYSPTYVTRHESAQVLRGVAASSVATGGLALKNVHTDFLENYDAHPRYAFEYGVNDPHTGDIKQQKEERDGEVVKGQYSLVEPDGSVRTVNYVADWDTGFHADVRNSKDSQH